MGGIIASRLIDLENDMTNEKSPTTLVYTVEAAGKALGIGRNSAYDAVRTGEIPSFRVGRRILIPRAALEKKLAEAGTIKQIEAA